MYPIKKHVLRSLGKFLYFVNINKKYKPLLKAVP